MPALIDISKALKDKAAGFIEEVQANIHQAYPHNDYIRNNANTMRPDVTEQNLSVWGGLHFENVEEGIPPIFDKGPFKPAGVTQKIYEWSIKKGIQFDKDYQRRGFAYVLRRKIFFEGTQLYRSGGRKDIYTPQKEKLFNDIAAAFTRALLNTPIIIK